MGDTTARGTSASALGVVRSRESFGPEACERASGERSAHDRASRRKSDADVNNSNSFDHSATDDAFS